MNKSLGNTVLDCQPGYHETRVHIYSVPSYNADSRQQL